MISDSDERRQRLNRALRRSAGKDTVKIYRRMLADLTSSPEGQFWRFLSLEQSDPILDQMSSAFGSTKIIIDEAVHPRLSLEELRTALGFLLGEFDSDEKLFISWKDTPQIGLLELSTRFVVAIVLDFLEIDRDWLRVQSPSSLPGFLVDREDLESPYALAVWGVKGPPGSIPVRVVP